MDRTIKLFVLMMLISFIGQGCLGGNGDSSTSPTTTENNSGATGTSSSINVNGHWEGTFQETYTDNKYNTPYLSTTKMSLDITQNANTITGDAKNIGTEEYYNEKYKGTISGTIGKNTIILTVNNGNIKIFINGVLDGNAITGTFSRVGDFGSYGTETREGNFVINRG